MTPPADPRGLYSSRVREYLLYRPGYPRKVADLLMEEFRLDGASVVADIGSGTGRFTALFDRRVGRVYAVEPNDEMRLASVEVLRNQKNCTVAKGDAENTGLESGSVDLVVCAHAFHYFDREAARTEFCRILKRVKNAAIVWNRRNLKSPFLADLDGLLRRRTPDFSEITHHNLSDESVLDFFRDGAKSVVRHAQKFSFQALCGRLKSSVYCPLPGEENHDRLFQELEVLFGRYEKNGLVDYPYDAEIFFGTI